MLQAIDIVELIGRTVSLKRRGKDYVGLCPFHQEKTPSFSVNPSKQFFKCFGCNAFGNAIDFVIQRDRIEFIDALRLLGEEAGLEMPGRGARPKAGEKQALLDAQSAACAFFEKLLADPVAGRVGREYLQSRGFNDTAVKQFQIGVAPEGWDGFLRSAVGRKFPPGQLALAGLAKARENGGGFYDTFRSRLMFPIRDENGRVIAFGGREMPGVKNPPKYLNSPDTPLFSKSRSIFGLDLARQRIVETRTVVVVEGYTDVIMAHQCGVSNVVSPLGTALTEQHVAILRRFADRIVLLFDADAAGDSATDRAVGLFLTQPIEIAIASMPPDVDPDEFLLKNGPEAFEQVVAGAQDALSFQWKLLQRRFDASGSDLTGQQKAVETYLERLAAARGTGPVDSLRWGQALARVSRLTDVPTEQLQKRFAPKRGAGTRPTPVRKPLEADLPDAAVPDPEPEPENAEGAHAERWILGVLLEDPHRWHKLQQEIGLEDFRFGRHRRLAEVYWNHQRDEGEPVFNELLGLLKGDTSLVELAIAVRDEVAGLGDLDVTLAGAVGHLKRERTRREEQRKLMAASRRSNNEVMSDSDELLLLRKISQNARQPDLRRG